MKELTFKQLWDAYPSDDHPCKKNGKLEFESQCAIRMGTALAKCGVDTTLLKVKHCGIHPNKDGHVLRAEELAQALKRTKIPGLASYVNLEAAHFKTTLAGKTGIIFFKDYWLRDRDSKGRPTGDHIDLWNESRLTSIFSWLRIQLGIVVPGTWSDLEKAKCVWFWRVT